MVRYFLKHQWLQFRRSSAYERELSFTIFIWFITFLVMLSLLSLSYALPKVIHEIPDVSDPILFINKALIYYFMGELLMRYFLQKVPALDIQPYLSLPISRQHIARFLLGKSLLSPFNLMALTLVIPLAIQIILPIYGMAGTIAWLCAIAATSIAIHFINILFKKKLEDLPIVWAILVVLAGANYLLSNYYSIDLFKPLFSGLMGVLSTPYLVLLPVLITMSMVYVTNTFFKKNLYLEELIDDSESNIENYSEKLGFLGKSSLSNTLILQEIKMIIRHKRTRSVLLISLIFVGYGLLFFGRSSFADSKGFLLFIGIFMSGTFSINYGQFFWSWNTNQLDFFFTRPIAVKTWLKSRYNLIVASCVITTLLCIPYVYFGWDVLFLIIASAIYNIGINIPLMMRLSMWGPKPIELSKGAIMNYQGTGAAQWLMGIPLMAGSFLFYVPMNLLFGHYAGMSCVAAAGIIGFTLRDYFFSLIIGKLRKVKYKLIHDLTL